MSLVFLHPELLILPPLAAAAGWLLLRRRNAPEYPFTVLDFWPAETNTEAGRKRAVRDWPWVLVLAAAVVATLAFSSPQLRIRPLSLTPSRSINLRAVGRDLPGNSRAVDIFVRCADINTGGTYQIIVTTHHQQLRRTATGNMLKRGMDISPVKAERHINVTLKDAHQIVARSVLRRLSIRKTIAAHFIGSPPPAFVRLFAALPDVTLRGQMADRNIFIIHQTNFHPQTLHAIPNSAFILLGNTPGPGLMPGRPLRLARGAALTALNHGGLLRAVDTTGVRVRQIVTAKLDSHWHTLIDVRGHPWLAERTRRADDQMWLWLGGEPNSEWNTWPKHASFVIFFANVLAQLQQAPGSGDAIHWWREAVKTPSGIIYRKKRHRPLYFDLGPLLALPACACLLAAMVALTWRERKLPMDSGL